MKSWIRVVFALSAFAFVASRQALAGDKALVDTSRSPHAVMHMPDMADVRWSGGLLGDRFDVARDVMVPHLWTIFCDPNESHAWDNFLMAAGLGEGRGDGKPHGPPFNDGDFLKWLEAAIQVYAVTRDAELLRQIDEIIPVIAKAQREDGYLHTQKIVPQRRGQTGVVAKEFEDREHFETYNMGHLMTTACVHYRVTGQTTLLDCARKAADYIDRLCKEHPVELAQNAICPSHYMGVVELYRITREPRYLELAKRLIEIRSLVPPAVASDHNQDRTPWRETTEAVGHAVRANYLYAGVADLYAETGDKTLLPPLSALAEDVAGQKLYITGMTGALYDGASPDGAPAKLHPQIKTVHQAYGRDYQLPNLTAYNETCATIGYGMWMWRQLALTGDAHLADLFEQTLYNGILPGISLEGRDYFYVNPLRKSADFTYPLRWSRTRQPNIKSSFCCPPNVVRVITEAHNYVYALSDNAVWVNLYAASTLDTALPDGSRIKLRQQTDYPWSGAVKFIVDQAPSSDWTLRLRVPGWLRDSASLRVNGQPYPVELTPGAYADLRRQWRAGDTVDFAMEFKPTLWEANPLVEETLNQVAIKYGPLVYCLESNDLPEGVKLKDVAIALSSTDGFVARREKIAGAELVTFTFDALVLKRTDWTARELYREVDPRPPQSIVVKAVPYYAWGNRGDTDMSVWIPVR